MEEQKNTTENLKDILSGKGEKSEKADKADVERNKAMAIIGYIIPLLFFIPLLNDETKNSKFAKFHANQQLILLIFGFVGLTVSGFLTVILIGFLLYAIVWVGSVIFIIMGIINAANGEMKKLPIIGDFDILK